MKIKTACLPEIILLSKAAFSSQYMTTQLAYIYKFNINQPPPISKDYNIGFTSNNVNVKFRNIKILQVLSLLLNNIYKTDCSLSKINASVFIKNTLPTWTNTRKHKETLEKQTNKQACKQTNTRKQNFCMCNNHIYKNCL